MFNIGIGTIFNRLLYRNGNLWYAECFLNIFVHCADIVGESNNIRNARRVDKSKYMFWGPLGWLLRSFGGHPVDRSAPGGIVDQTAAEIRAAERMWFVLAPEGTRKRVETWKTGFWKIARRADVPVMCAWFHYPERTIGLGPLVELSDDMAADMARIREIYRPYQGKNRGTT